MELKQTLIDISNDARGWLHAWGDGFKASDARDSGGTKTNPITWQLGHLAATEDDVFQLFSGKPGIVPEAVRAACGTGCPPPTEETVYPTLKELWELLDQTHAELLGLAEAATEDDFDNPPLQDNPYFRSLGQAIYEVALHENYHVGEIGSLRKALGKKPIG